MPFCLLAYERAQGLHTLPSHASILADCFKGAFCSGHWTAESLPTVHCYSFLRGHETQEELKLVNGPRQRCPACLTAL